MTGVAMNFGDNQDIANMPGHRARTFVAQRTFASSIHCKGMGVHGGRPVMLSLHPAHADSGIVFRRTDLKPAIDIPASWDRVTDTKLCTVISTPDGRASIGTVEHLMAALAGCGIDNALIEIDGPEVPIVDGSAEPFVFLIRCAGIVEQAVPRRAIKVLKPVSVVQDGKRATLRPAPDFSLSCEIDFKASVIGRQVRVTHFSETVFQTELANARTFGFLEDVAMLRRAGLGLGGSLDNAIVIGDNRVLNRGGLRYADEFVRHKTLDAVGDLYLAGHPLLAHFEGVKSGHAMNNAVLHALFADASAWTEVEMGTTSALFGAGNGSVLQSRAAAGAEF